jgi:hypothetical protein
MRISTPFAPLDDDSISKLPALGSLNHRLPLKLNASGVRPATAIFKAYGRQHRSALAKMARVDHGQGHVWLQ